MSTPILSWWPRDGGDYAQLTEFMSLEQEGAYNRLERVCMTAAKRGEPPGTIADDPAVLERILGANWRGVEALVRRLFQVNPAYPGRLYCAEFALLYAKQARRYELAQKAGKTSAKKRERAAADRRSRGRKSRDTNPLNAVESSLATERQRPCSDKDIFESSSTTTPPESIVDTTAPDGAAVGRGGATSAPPSPTHAAPPPPAPPASRELSRVRRAPPLPGRTALMRDVAPSDHREPDDGPTTAQLEHWLRSRPDAEAAFTQTWQSMADEDPHAEPGFLRVPALRSTWRALRDAPLPAHAAASGAA